MIALSPEGNFLAIARQNNQIEILHIQSGEEYLIPKSHDADISSLEFSPNEETLAVAYKDGLIVLWDEISWQVPIKELKSTSFIQGNNSEILAIEFSPNGNIMAISTYDGIVELWDISNRRKLQTLSDHKSAVWGLSFSSDSQTLATASYDGRIIIWDFNLENLLEKSCEWWRNYLTHGNPSEEEKALCPHITPTQPLHATLWHWGRNLLGMATHTP